MVEEEAVASTVAEVEAAISAVAELDRVSVEVHALAAQAALAGLLLGRSAEEGLELTVIDLMGCTVAEAWARQLHVTAQCQGTDPIQG